jgi:hypothetical protein
MDEWSKKKKKAKVFHGTTVLFEMSFFSFAFDFLINHNPRPFQLKM